MPSHYGSGDMKDKMKKLRAMKKSAPPKKKMSEMKLPKPMMKPRKDLSKGQKQLMKEHKTHHTPAHMKEMTKLMKKGYCFQQAHDITMKIVGK
tara:strand:+ start:168 stop:446 length:279 start_codon:yes stop_codon:yes gene_type:complete